MAKMPIPKEMGAAPKIVAAPKTAVPKMSAAPKMAAAPAVASMAKPATNRLANLGAFAHPSKRKKKG